MIYTFRKATADDLDHTWVWRNDPVTRRMARSPTFVDRPRYTAWFETLQADPDQLMLVAAVDDTLIAYATFAPFEKGWSAVMSLTIAPDHRGQGHGTALVDYFAFMGGDHLSVGEIVAHIRDENTPSRTIFERAGFRWLCCENDIHRYRLTL
jgi:RimJ/RimL family protein N-acetyltransferase